MEEEKKDEILENKTQEQSQNEVKEVKQEEKKQLSDDELYTQIQTEKLLNKKKVKKIITLSSLCFAFVLAICLIVLAAVPVNLTPRCIVGGYSTVKLYKGNSEKRIFDTENPNEEYVKLMNQMDNSFKKSYLSAIFSGSLYSYSIKEERLPNIDSLDDIPSILQSDNIYHVQIMFNEEQIFTNQNGSRYSSMYGSNPIWDGQLTYRYAYIVANQSSELSTSTIYVVGKSSILVNNEKVDRFHLLTITVKANTYPIYQIWNDLTPNVV